MTGTRAVPVEPAPATRGGARPGLVAAAVDTAVVAVWFAVAGLVGAVVWWRVTPLPQVTKSGGSATLSPQDLVSQVGIDGWFFVVAAVGGLLSGTVLLIWRRRDPLLMVALLALGGALASWLMVHVGLALGPDAVVPALRRLPDGAHVSMQLKLHAPGMAWIWPIAAVLAALVQLWVVGPPRDERD